MNCPRCRRRVPLDDAYCAYCSWPLDTLYSQPTIARFRYRPPLVVRLLPWVVGWVLGLLAGRWLQ